jgi:hypothetical protein
VKGFLYHGLKAIHDFLSRKCIVCSGKDRIETEARTLCGKWIGSARFVALHFDEKQMRLLPLENPGWEAMVFPQSGGPAIHIPCANRKEAEEALPGLIQKHFGRCLVLHERSPK